MGRKESTMVEYTVCLNLKKLQQTFIMVRKEFHKSVEADIIDVQYEKEIHKPRQVWFKAEQRKREVVRAYTSGAQSCADLYPTLCPSMGYLCNNNFYQSYMASNCPLTCQLCTPVPTTTTTLSSSQCYDASPTCPYSAYLCNSTFYQSLMAEYCPLTCGLCTPAPTTIDPCSDKSWIPNTPPSCSAYAGLCNIQVFQAIMTQYCPKTCGFCSSTPPLGTTTPIPGGR